MNKPFVERRQDRRTDPMLATLVDVAIAYRDNLGWRVAEAFMLETGVPATLVRRVLERSASQRASVPRRWAPRAVTDPLLDRRAGAGTTPLDWGSGDDSDMRQEGAPGTGA